MSVQFRKSKAIGKNTRANVSKSGVSLSQKAGPLTVNSRGRASIRLAPGWSWRLGKGQTGPLALGLLAASLVMLSIWLTWMVVKLSVLMVYLPARWAVGKLVLRGDEGQGSTGGSHALD